ncbi:MAG: hypothetical protein AAFY71_16990 [Bacteroidota bacterium]
MKVALDKSSYKLLLAYKKATSKVDQKGNEEDFEFLYDDLWLQDAVVLERVVKLNGTWNLFLLFAHMNNPLLLIHRFIKTQYSFEKAMLDAVYMRRLAGKDQRGTLKLNTNQFQISSN